VKRSALRGLGGATLAVAAFFAATLLSRALDERSRSLAPAPSEDQVCAAAACEAPVPVPAPAAPAAPAAPTAIAPAPASAPPHPFLSSIDRELAERMPSLARNARRRVARAVVEEAQKAHIDPLLVLALIRVESAFDPEALSDAGALGLMQLRAPTLRRELQRAGLPHLDLRDPAANVVAGVRYLRRLIDAFGHDEDVALMAYNAGPNRILAYLREDGEIPERFQAFPRRVKAVHRSLRRHLEARRPAAASQATAVAQAPGPAPQTAVR
jgi:soluble lytic murein transglycosylase